MTFIARFYSVGITDLAAGWAAATKHSFSASLQPSSCSRRRSILCGRGEDARLCWQLRPKTLVAFENGFAAGHLYAGSVAAQPVTNRADCFARLVVVCADILAGDIGTA